MACEPNMQRIIILFVLPNSLDVLTIMLHFSVGSGFFKKNTHIFLDNLCFVLASSRKFVPVPSFFPQWLQHGIADAWLTPDWHLHPSLVNAYGKY